ncbi:5' nucleotidase, NT5C type [Psychrobacillus vulpis]|uniref:5'-3'-deoxyribonucleotidase n=1 Tax=Psychrobacillus vulpis TaxID=2325572 RepID=A0A544TT87_9BACI|nr:5'-3'-deoxyribonucleotidase [Psychrobacillus vulpis]TQR20653.1 5'-3'-deoxyribonucleotidase [Psychrobacillus vulpis]
MKRIAIDMDEVISQFSTKCIQLFNNEFNINYSVNDLHGKKLVELDKRFERKVNEYLSLESFFLSLEVVKDSQQVIKKLSSQYEIFIVTAAMDFPSSLAPKYKWLKKNYDFLNEKNFVFCGDKSIIRADYLIDDTPENLETFKGKGILFTAPHNMQETRYFRLNNWYEIEKYFNNK